MRGRFWQTDPHPEDRDSFHYKTPEKQKKRIRIREGMEGGRGRDSFYYRAPEWKSVPMARPATVSDVQCEAVRLSAGCRPLIKSVTYPDTLSSLQTLMHAHTHTHTLLCRVCRLTHSHTIKALCILDYGFRISFS